MKCILDRFFGAKLQQETNAYLAELARAPVLASRRRARELLSRLREESGSKITLGKTVWGEPVELPVRDFLKDTGVAMEARSRFNDVWWPALGAFFAGNAGYKVLMRGMKPLCAGDARSFYLAEYGMDASTPRSRQAFLERVRRRVSQV